MLAIYIAQSLNSARGRLATTYSVVANTKRLCMSIMIVKILEMQQMKSEKYVAMNLAKQIRWCIFFRLDQTGFS